MKITKKAVTLVEAVVTLAILGIGLVGVYQLYNNSIRFLDGVSAKTQAIQIAREGIEAVENIRDTNWKLFPSNTENCWRVKDYDKNCILNAISTENLGGTISDTDGKNYRLNKINPNGGAPEISLSKWYLEETSSTNLDYLDENYRNFYKIKKDLDGLYFQGNDDDKSESNFSGKNYTRRINIKVSEGAPRYEGPNPNDISTDGELITVTSIVEWRDMSSSEPRKIELTNVMTNYKK